jgi:hypothetical protein
MLLSEPDDGVTVIRTKMGLVRPTTKLDACPNPTQDTLALNGPEGITAHPVAALDYKRDFFLGEGS